MATYQDVTHVPEKISDRKSADAERRSPAFNSPALHASLKDQVIILSCPDDSLLIEVTQGLRPYVKGLMVIAAPDSELLQMDVQDAKGLQIFLGDTSVESQAELCVERAVKAFGRADALLVVTHELVDESGDAWSSVRTDLIDPSSAHEMRISEFDHLLYSKIRSVYLLSRFVRKVSRRMSQKMSGRADVSTSKILIARKQTVSRTSADSSDRASHENLDVRAVLCATRSWMKSFAEQCQGGSWIVFETIEDFSGKLSKAFEQVANDNQAALANPAQ